jgi:hypothetical protein
LNHWFAENWEIDRIGNKTKVMCPIVQLHRKLFITCWRNRYRWLETYFGKLAAAIRRFQYCPDRGILPINDNDSRCRTQMQISAIQLTERRGAIV